MKKLFFLFIMALMPMALMAVEAEIDGLWYELAEGDKEAKVITSKNEEYSGNLTIPLSVEYKEIIYTVTCIGDWAFSHCSKITSVVIPNSVTRIEKGAFYECSALYSITTSN